MLWTTGLLSVGGFFVFVLFFLSFLVFFLFCFVFTVCSLVCWFGVILIFKAWLSYPTPSYPINSGAFANCIMLSVWVLRGCGMKIFQSLGTMQVHQRHLRNPALLKVP